MTDRNGVEITGENPIFNINEPDKHYSILNKDGRLYFGDGEELTWKHNTEEIWEVVKIEKPYVDEYDGIAKNGL